MKKYSESKIKAAQKFLSKYNLSFDALDEPQKQVVISYTYLRNFLTVCLIALTFGLVVFSVLAYVYYNRAYATIDQISNLSSPSKAIDLRTYGESCFGRGINFGVHSIGAFMMLIYIVLFLAGLRGKFQMLNAFLPALKHPSGNINGLKGQDTLAQGNALGEKTAP
jgi:hypothetical protein